MVHYRASGLGSILDLSHLLVYIGLPVHMQVASNIRCDLCYSVAEYWFGPIWSRSCHHRFILDGTSQHWGPDFTQVHKSHGYQLLPVASYSVLGTGHQQHVAQYQSSSKLVCVCCLLWPHPAWLASWCPMCPELHLSTTARWTADWLLASVVNHTIIDVTNPITWQPLFKLTHHIVNTMLLSEGQSPYFAYLHRSDLTKSTVGWVRAIKSINRQRQWQIHIYTLHTVHRYIHTGPVSYTHLTLPTILRV